MFFVMHESFFNNFLLIDEINRSKISSNHHQIFFDVSLYPLWYFANTPFMSYLTIEYPNEVWSWSWYFWSKIQKTRSFPSKGVISSNGENWNQVSNNLTCYLIISVQLLFVFLSIVGIMNINNIAFFKMWIYNQSF